MAHEKSITIGTKKGFVNIPTVVKGKTVSDKEAVRLHTEGKNKALGKTHKTLTEAVDAAKVRSKAAGKKLP